MDSPTCFRSIYCIDGCAEATHKPTVTTCAEPPSTDGPANEPRRIQSLYVPQLETVVILGDRHPFHCPTFHLSKEQEMSPVTPPLVTPFIPGKAKTATLLSHRSLVRVWMRVAPMPWTTVQTSR